MQMIKHYITLLIIVLTSSCSEYRLLMGAGAHSNKVDDNNWQHENPIGFIRGEANYNFTSSFYTGGFCEHVSAMFVQDTQGLNYCGVQTGYKWSR